MKFYKELEKGIKGMRIIGEDNIKQQKRRLKKLQLLRKAKSKQKELEGQTKTLVKPKFNAGDRKFSLFLSDQYMPNLSNELIKQVESKFH